MDQGVQEGGGESVGDVAVRGWLVLRICNIDCSLIHYERKVARCGCC